LKNIKDPKNTGNGIDRAKINHMVEHTHPDPEQCQNSRNDLARPFVLAKGQGKRHDTQQIGHYLKRPYGYVVGSENIEELLDGKRYVHIILFFETTLCPIIMKSTGVEIGGLEISVRTDILTICT
jgi:hypothetical protein